MPFVGRRLPLMALAAVLGVLAALGIRVATEQHAATAGHTGTVNARASWRFHFDTSAEMLATADLVIEGDVTGVRRGRILAGDSPTRQQLKEYRMQVTRTWKGSATAGPITVEGPGWEISSVPGEGELELVFTETIEPAPGDHAIVYLTRNKGDGRLTYINNQGVFILKDGQVEGSSRTDPMVTAMERRSAAALRQRLQADLELVATGAVTPKRAP
jgi:hypothetical protein